VGHVERRDAEHGLRLSDLGPQDAWRVEFGGAARVILTILDPSLRETLRRGNSPGCVRARTPAGQTRAGMRYGTA
jgi:hypothetical protein